MNTFYEAISTLFREDASIKEQRFVGWKGVTRLRNLDRSGGISPRRNSAYVSTPTVEFCVDIRYILNERSMVSVSIGVLTRAVNHAQGVAHLGLVSFYTQRILQVFLYSCETVVQLREEVREIDTCKTPSKVGAGGRLAPRYPTGVTTQPTAGTFASRVVLLCKQIIPVSRVYVVSIEQSTPATVWEAVHGEGCCRYCHGQFREKLES